MVEDSSLSIKNVCGRFALFLALNGFFTAISVPKILLPFVYGVWSRVQELLCKYLRGTKNKVKMRGQRQGNNQGSGSDWNDSRTNNEILQLVYLKKMVFVKNLMP